MFQKPFPNYFIGLRSYILYWMNIIRVYRSMFMSIDFVMPTINYENDSEKCDPDVFFARA